MNTSAVEDDAKLVRAQGMLGDFELTVCSDGSFLLDGGAMFGVVPRPLWEKKFPPDERNRIQLAANLRGIVSLKLLPRSDRKGLVPASEVLLPGPALSKALLQADTQDLAAAMEMELSAYNRLFKTADRREGVASFNEKRTPAFKGA